MNIVSRRDLLDASLERTPSIRGTTRHVWIAADRTASAGKGTLDSPLSANTRAKVDAIIDTYTGTGINFFWLPGDYETLGWYWTEVYRRTVRPYQKHFCAGMYNVTFRLVNQTLPAADGIIFAQNYNDLCDGFELHDCTLDANNANSPKKDLGLGNSACLHAHGSFIHIRNVRCIGYGTNSHGTENFPMGLGGTIGHAARLWQDIWVRGCRFELPDSDNLDGVTCCGIYVPKMANPLLGGAGLQHVQRNCYVEDCYFADHGGKGFIYTQGVGAQVVRRCHFEIGVGIYNELTNIYVFPISVFEGIPPTHPNWEGPFGSGDSAYYLYSCGQGDELSYTDNTFIIPASGGTGCLIRYGSRLQSHLDAVTFSRNRVFYLGDAGMGFATDPGGGESGTIRNFIAQDNEFRAMPGVEITDGAGGIGLASIESARVTDNTFAMGYHEDLREILTYGDLNTGIFMARNLRADGSLANVYRINGPLWQAEEDKIQLNDFRYKLQTRQLHPYGATYDVLGSYIATPEGPATAIFSLQNATNNAFAWCNLTSSVTNVTAFTANGIAFNSCSIRLRLAFSGMVSGKGSFRIIIGSDVNNPPPFAGTNALSGNGVAVEFKSAASGDDAKCRIITYKDGTGYVEGTEWIDFAMAPTRMSSIMLVTHPSGVVELYHSIGHNLTLPFGREPLLVSTQGPVGASPTWFGAIRLVASNAPSAEDGRVGFILLDSYLDIV